MYSLPLSPQSFLTTKSESNDNNNNNKITTNIKTKFLSSQELNKEIIYKWQSYFGPNDREYDIDKCDVMNKDRKEQEHYYYEYLHFDFEICINSLAIQRYYWAILNLSIISLGNKSSFITWLHYTQIRLQNFAFYLPKLLFGLELGKTN